MQDQGHVPPEIQRLEPGIEVADMVEEAVVLRGELGGLAHAHEIGRQAPAAPGGEGQDVPPEIGRCRIAVQKDDRIALPDLDEAHLGIEHRDAPARMRIYGTDLACTHDSRLFPCQTNMTFGGSRRD